jgi:hypothetical protein
MGDSVNARVGSRIWRPVVHSKDGAVIKDLQVEEVNRRRFVFRAQQGVLFTRSKDTLHMACDGSGVGGMVCFANKIPDNTAYFEVVKVAEKHLIVKPHTCGVDELLEQYTPWEDVSAMGVFTR